MTNMDNEAQFTGFADPSENWFKMPLAIIPMQPDLKGSVLHVVIYIIRHTWGFHEYEEGKKITLDEFQNGRKRRDGTRIDNGTGLHKETIVNALVEAEAMGIIDVETDSRDAGRIEKFYMLRRKNQVSENPTSDQEESDTSGRKIRQRTEKDTLEKKLEETNSSSDSASRVVSPRGVDAPLDKEEYTARGEGAPMEDRTNKLEGFTPLEQLIITECGTPALSGAQVNKLNAEIEYYDPVAKVNVKKTLNELYETKIYREWIKYEVAPVMLMRKEKQAGIGKISRSKFIDALSRIGAFSTWWSNNLDKGKAEVIPTTKYDDELQRIK